MTSNHSIQDIKATLSHITPIISDSTSTVSVSSHPDCQSYNPHCMYIIATVCMTSHELHMTSHPLFMTSHHSMTSHPLYSCHHTIYIWHHIHCSCIITHSVLIIPHLLYVWHQTHSMYDIIWILYDITPTHYDITRLYSWHHIHSIDDSTPTVYEITYTLLVTSQVVKQEMARVDIDILGISELKWTGMGEFSSNDHYIYYCGQESLRRKVVVIIVKERVQNDAVSKTTEWSLFVSKANHSVSQ